MTKPQNLFGVVWMGFTPLKQPRKLTLGVLQNLLSNSVNSASLFYCLLDLAWASWLEQRTFKIYWVTQYILKMSPFDLRQHCRLTIWNNWLSRQIAGSVSDVKIQITLLILRRGAWSNLRVYIWLHVPVTSRACTAHCHLVGPQSTSKWQPWNQTASQKTWFLKNWQSKTE